MNSITYSVEDWAEQSGNLIAHNALNHMLSATSQAESLGLMQTALLELQRLPHPMRAAGGLASELLAIIELTLGA
jgi:hypothetical protein